MLTVLGFSFSKLQMWQSSCWSNSTRCQRVRFTTWRSTGILLTFGQCPALVFNTSLVTIQTLTEKRNKSPSKHFQGIKDDRGPEEQGTKDQYNYACFPVGEKRKTSAWAKGIPKMHAGLSSSSTSVHNLCLFVLAGWPCVQEHSLTPPGAKIIVFAIARLLAPALPFLTACACVRVAVGDLCSS